MNQIFYVKIGSFCIILRAIFKKNRELRETKKYNIIVNWCGC